MPIASAPIAPTADAVPFEHDGRPHGSYVRWLHTASQPRWSAFDTNGDPLGVYTALNVCKAALRDKGEASPADPYDGRTPADVPGLRGKALQTYLDTGKRLRVQIAEAPLTKLGSDELPAPTPTEPKAAKPRKAKATEPKATSAADIARAAGIEPKAFRKFLRSSGLPAGDDAVKAFKAAN